AGVVESSNVPRFQPGQEVIITGCGLGETFDGGYSQYVRAPAEAVVARPEGLTLEECMILGTAGFTAGLCALRMIHNGQTPDKGPIVITGATGGVGSFAIQIFSHLGFEVHAVSGKSQSHDYLKELGAHKVI